jgi:hypothetical protein
MTSLRLEVTRSRRAASPTAQAVHFSGFYVVPEDSEDNNRALVHAVNAEVLAATQFRFT